MADVLVEARARFEPDELSAVRARRFVRDTLEGVVRPGVQADVVLAASELTSNVVRHVGTPYEVTVVVDGTVRIEVSDGDPSPPRPRLVTNAEACGRGLHIVGALARTWGSIPTDGGKRVWAEFEL